MREAEGAYQMIGEEEKTSKMVEEVSKEWGVTDSRDLKVKLGVAKEESSEDDEPLVVNPLVT